MNSVTFVLCLLVLGAHSLLVFGVECNIDGKKLKAGEKYTAPGQCVEYTCHDNNAISAVGCTTVASLKPCKVTEGDLSQPYPACCTHFEDC